jgi:hypothetical protein
LERWSGLEPTFGAIGFSCKNLGKDRPIRTKFLSSSLLNTDFGDNIDSKRECDDSTYNGGKCYVVYSSLNQESGPGRSSLLKLLIRHLVCCQWRQAYLPLQAQCQNFVMGLPTSSRVYSGLLASPGRRDRMVDILFIVYFLALSPLT